MADQTNRQNAPELPRRPYSSLFARALREDSNLALDWLYVADKVSDDLEREYCLKRAYYIDPNCIAIHYPQQNLSSRLMDLIQHIFNKDAASNAQSDEQFVANI